MQIDDGGRGGPGPAVGIAALVVLTAAEIATATAGGVARATRIGLLGGLLTLKATVVLVVLMRARASRRAARLTIAAVGAAVGFAVVLMLETAFRARVR